MAGGATVTTPASVSAYQRDVAGRELRLIENVGDFFRCQTQSYDMCGRLLSRTDYLGRTSTTEYYDTDSTRGDYSYNTSIASTIRDTVPFSRDTVPFSATGY